MKKKVYVLVLHNKTPFLHYGMHEALMEEDNVYWVGSKPIRTFDDYHIAVSVWSKHEPRSSHLDILDEADAEKFYDKVDYSDVEELNFDD